MIKIRSNGKSRTYIKRLNESGPREFESLQVKKRKN